MMKKLSVTGKQVDIAYQQKQSGNMQNKLELMKIASIGVEIEVSNTVGKAKEFYPILVVYRIQSDRNTEIVLVYMTQ